MLKDLLIELQELQKTNPEGILTPAAIRKGALVHLRGKDLIDFTCWDFFNLRSNKKLNKAISAELNISGFTPGAPRIGSGNLAPITFAERRMAEFVGSEGALIFGSKNQMLLTLVTALCDERDYIFFEECMDAPIADAAALVGSHAAHFSIERTDVLAQQLEKAKGIRRKFIFIEPLSFVSGQVAPLNDIFELATRYGAHVILDESVSIGLMGDRGEGSTAQFGCPPALLCRIFALNRAIGCLGACIAGPQVLLGLLIAKSKRLAIDVALPGFLGSALEVAINTIELQIGSREKLKTAADRLLQRFSEMGLPRLEQTGYPVIAIPFDKVKACRLFHSALFERGIHADMILSPKMGSAESFVRIILNVEHTEEHLNTLLESLSEIKKRAE